MNFGALSVSVLISCNGFSCLTPGELQDDMNPVSTKKKVILKHFNVIVVQKEMIVGSNNL